jgi:hypothetical protein
MRISRKIKEKRLEEVETEVKMLENAFGKSKDSVSAPPDSPTRRNEKAPT